MARAQALTVLQTYAALRRAVEEVIVKGQQSAELAKVRTYHETGRLIHEHVLLHQERAKHGHNTLHRLARDVGVDLSVLQRCVQFYRAFPNSATWRNLSWAHYRVLIPVADPRLRRTLATEADRARWPVHRLELHIRALQPPVPVDDVIPMPVAPARLLTPRRGTPGVCKVIAAGDDTRVVDLGFSVYRDAGPSTRLAVGDFVRVEPDGIALAQGASKADLFTYHAEVLKVVDGDTLWVKVYLEPERWVKQKLRLRDLDCPEMDTAAGKAAKRFVEALMAKAEAVTICTTKPDKYDRYLADVYLMMADLQSPENSTKEGELFLNNELIRHGHAVRKGDYSPADWE